MQTHPLSSREQNELKMAIAHIISSASECQNSCPRSSIPECTQLMSWLKRLHAYEVELRGGGIVVPVIDA